MKDVENTSPLIKAAKRAEKMIAGAWRYRTADEWEALGIRRQRVDGDLPRAVRETSVAFLDADSYATVDTARPAWMRRLEKDGAVPFAIATYLRGEGENRVYHIPKRWLHIPYDATRRKADEPEPEDCDE